jgi:hypothetical protein
VDELVQRHEVLERVRVLGRGCDSERCRGFDGLGGVSNGAEWR